MQLPKRQQTPGSTLEGVKMPAKQSSRETEDIKLAFLATGSIKGTVKFDADCGCSIISDPKTKINKHSNETKIYNYYHCTNGRKVHASLKGKSITEEKIWTNFETAVDSITIDSKLAEEIAEALNVVHHAAKNITGKQMELYRCKLASLEQREDEIYDDFKNKILDSDGYERQLKRVRVERAEFTNTLEKLQLELQDSFMETAQSILELAKDAKTLWLSRAPMERRMFLDKILSNPVLNGANIEFNLRKPFAVLAEIAQKDDWRSQRDSNSRILREREVS